MSCAVEIHQLLVGMTFMRRDMPVSHPGSPLHSLPLTVIAQAFRLGHGTPVRLDSPSMIESYNDTRARPGHKNANIKHLIESLASNSMFPRKDDSLVPGKDFMPRVYPGMIAYVPPVVPNATL